MFTGSLANVTNDLVHVNDVAEAAVAQRRDMLRGTLLEGDPRIEQMNQNALAGIRKATEKIFMAEASARTPRDRKSTW